jgi:phage terminase Nu1 subunit (DNA packaging protein)
MAKGDLGPLIGRKELAAAMDVHPMTVTKWTGAGCPVAEPGRPGVSHKYRESEVRAWLKMREESAERGGAIDLTHARAEREHWQAKLNEQKYRQLLRELLPADEVEAAWRAEVAAIRAQLLAIPITVADRIHRAAVLEGVNGVERVLDEVIRKALAELADPERDDMPRRRPRKKPAKKTKQKRARKKIAKKAGASRKVRKKGKRKTRRRK